MNILLVGDKMQAVMDAIVDYKREATDALYEDMGELIEILNERDEEIADLEEVVEVLVDDNRELVDEIQDLKICLEMVKVDRAELLDLVSAQADALMEYRIQELFKDAPEQPRGFAQFKNESAEKIAEAVKASCCEAGFCGADKCGGSCKDEPKATNIPSPGTISFIGFDDSFF